MIERIDLQTVDLQSGAAAVINGAIPVAPFTIAGQEYRTSVPAPEARLDLVRSVNGWHFRLRADATVVGPCWRCLEDARVDIHADATETSEDGTSDPDLTSLYLDHGILDVAAWMRDAVVEELPPAIHCREDCAGLCPQCGANLNTDPCDCEPPPDPRWSGLAELADRLAEQEREAETRGDD
ncbi:MAG: DUF177 domain-containing protein [Actinobacteria bacterium]|nr:DUF177 domain-containing protein [Actinomycetota bacterium]